MKTPRILVRLALGLGLTMSLTLTSCNDNCSDISSGDNGNKPQLTDLEWDKQITLQRLLGALASQDTLPANWNASSYIVSTPTIGEPADEATPNAVRLVATCNVEQAYREYCSYIGKTADTEPTADTWQMDGIGSVSFTPNNEAALYATVKVNIKQLPSLQEIRFVPPTALGNNDGDDVQYYYSFGDVIQDKNGKYWVCVRPANKSLKLGKSHWCTFQLEESNFKKVEKNLTLPTGLSKNQAESETMVANLFNLMRIIYEPTQYEYVQCFDKFSNEKFTQADVEKLHSLWESENIWNLIMPDYYRQNNLYWSFINGCVSPNAFAFHVLHYGYTGNYSLLYQNSYKVYDLLMNARDSGKGLFTSSPWVTDVNWDGTKEVDLSKIAYENSSDQYKYFDTGKKDNKYLYTYVVRHCTGAQLQGRLFSNANDADPTEPFSTSAPSKQIKDILITKNRN